MSEENKDDRLPMHRVVIEGIKKTTKDLLNLENREPKLEPTTNYAELHDKIIAIKNHEKEAAGLWGELRGYLAVANANIKGEHLVEIKKTLWDLSYTGNHLIISALKKLESKE